MTGRRIGLGVSIALHTSHWVNGSGRGIELALYHPISKSGWPLSFLSEHTSKPLFSHRSAPTPPQICQNLSVGRRRGPALITTLQTHLGVGASTWVQGGNGGFEGMHAGASGPWWIHRGQALERKGARVWGTEVWGYVGYWKAELRVFLSHPFLPLPVLLYLIKQPHCPANLVSSFATHPLSLSTLCLNFYQEYFLDWSHLILIPPSSL